MVEFPPGFFARADETPDDGFYAVDRFVTHIDEAAVAAVGELYRELELTGEVLDLCASWVSHFDPSPRRLVALGMNANELAANPVATDWVVHDLNTDPVLPFDDGSFDAAWPSSGHLPASGIRSTPCGREGELGFVARGLG